MKILVCDDQPEAAEKVRGMVEELAASIIQTLCKKPPQVPEQHLRRLLFMLTGLSRGLKNA